MKFKDVCKVALLGGVLWASTSSAKADWMYSVSGLPTSINNGNSNFRLYAYQDNPLTLNPSALTVFAVASIYVGYPPAPAAFNYPLTAAVTINDGVNQATATFTGLLRSTPELLRSPPDVSPYFLPAIFTSPTQQSGVIDGHPYTIRINAYNPIPVYILTNPGHPIDEIESGLITGSIDVSASTNQAPEPSSFVLGCLASLGLFFHWRRLNLAWRSQG